MKLGAIETAKFKQFKRKLKIPQYVAVGILESLWMYTVRNAPLGNIGRHSDDLILSSIEWDGDDKALMDALIECQWLDVSDEHRLVVHDWDDHMPNWLKGHNAAAEKSKKTKPQNRSTNSPQATTLTKPEDDTEAHPQATPKAHPQEDSLLLSSLSKPFPPTPSLNSGVCENNSKQEKTKTTEAIPASMFDANDREGLVDPATQRALGMVIKNNYADAFWQAYPRKINYGTFPESYDHAIFHLNQNDGLEIEKAHEFLLGKAVEYAKSPAGKDHANDKRPAPSTWLANMKWRDDPKEWKTPNGGVVNGFNQEAKKVEKIDWKKEGKK